MEAARKVLSRLYVLASSSQVDLKVCAHLFPPQPKPTTHRAAQGAAYNSKAEYRDCELDHILGTVYLHVHEPRQPTSSG